MRIISGQLKGKSILFIKNNTTRPLKDSVKENIFNILEHSNLIEVKIKNANILDLYSGTGSFGLEGISREANKVVSVEQNKNALDLLEKNLLNLTNSKKVNVIKDKAENIHIWAKRNEFNVFFLDPPFSDFQFIQTLKVIEKNKIFQKKHIIIIHRERKTKDKIGDFFNPLIVKEYGRSKIIFGKFN